MTPRTDFSYTEGLPLDPEDRLRLAGFVSVILLAVLIAQTACTTPIVVVDHRLSPLDEHGIAVIVHMSCVTETPATTTAVTPSALGNDELDADLDALFGTIGASTTPAAPATQEHGWVGSGVLVSTERVLTNAHVVTCPEGKLTKLEVDAGDGVLRPAATEIVLARRDIARIRLMWATPESYVRPIEIGRMPVVGDSVCETPGYPTWGYKCGVVQPSPVGTLWAELHVIHGNSGSAVWAGGRLVGLTYAVMTCEDGMQCVGAVTPLVGMGWLLTDALTGPGDRP